MSAFICGDGSTDAPALAKQTATAFAHAVADASAHGDVHGLSCFEHSGAAVQDTAELWLNSYAEVLENSAECGLCKTWPESWEFVRKEVFLSALVNVELLVSTRTSILLEIEFKAVQMSAWCLLIIMNSCMLSQTHVLLPRL